MEVLLDPIVFRGIERLLIISGAIFFGYLGFKLLMFGVNTGYGKLSAEVSKTFKIVFSGTGPGLFFMAFGAIILFVGLYTGGAEVERQSRLGPIWRYLGGQIGQESVSKKEHKNGEVEEGPIEGEIMIPEEIKKKSEEIRKEFEEYLIKHDLVEK